MAHEQNSPRGLWAKKRIDIVGSSSNTITGDSTGIVLGAGIKISNQKSISANSTGLILPTSAAILTTRSSCKFAVLTNSTGQNAVLINTTGTTWKYLNVTSELPT